MDRVETSIEIAAAPDRVWEVAMDPERLADWVTIHRGLKRVSSGAAREGFEMEQALSLRGARFRVHWKLVECAPPHRAVWDGRGPARSRAHTIYELEPNGDGTRFHYVNEFEAPLGPLGAVASRALVGARPQREAKLSLDRLKRLVETR